MIGDMAKNGDLPSLDQTVRTGVYLHRTIDQVTDALDVMRSAAVPLRVRHGKYAPVVLDILLDYILVARWGEFCDIDFVAVEDWTYGLINQNLDRVPSRISRNLKGMAHHRWLDDYTSHDGLHRVMERMDRRARFESNFSAAAADLDEQQGVLSETLDEVWPVLVAKVEDVVGS